MEFTFGIITQNNKDCCNLVIDSIVKNNIPCYEIIIVGNVDIESTNTIKIIQFNEDTQKGWITRKKNIIAENAKYENIVLLHDYVILSDNWYDGFMKFGNNFDICVTKIINQNGQRFRDYTMFPYKVSEYGYIRDWSPGDIDPYFNNNCLLPYDFVNNKKLNKYMYISGAYYVIKREIALKCPLNEKLLHCQGEDVELCMRLHNNDIIIQCNQYSSVKFIKYKESMWWEREVDIDKLIKFIEKIE
jgi:hypothetical protein